MDEESLLKLCTASAMPEKGSSFQYYVVDNSTIIALLDQKLGNPEGRCFVAFPYRSYETDLIFMSTWFSLIFHRHSAISQAY
jgi:hypothetical protein